MVELNLPPYKFRLRKVFGKPEIFDIIRKKFVCLTPEEWVRQNFMQYLILEKKFPPQLLKIEIKHELNTRRKRCDIIACAPDGKPLVIIECKASHIPLDQKTLQQVTIYNLTHKAPHLMITNGIQHYSITLTENNRIASWKDNIPDYSSITEPLK